MNLIDAMRRAQRYAPVDVESLARELGVKVNQSFLDPDISGELVSRGDDLFEINVNARNSPTRQRFTIAHELGHYVYHRDLIGEGLDDDRAYRSTDAGRYHNKDIGPREETEANKFAASLLMPKHLIDQLLNEGLSVPEMASRLQVSEQAMAIRLGESPS